MERKIVIAGIGGQGVVYATKALSHAALARGEKVVASENHGMSQRGGSVLAHLKIGGSDAPLIRHGTADALIAFDRVEALRNLIFVRAGGKVIVNSQNGLDPAVMQRLNELEIGVLVVAADTCAQEIGAPGAANLITLGAAASQACIGLTLDDLREAVRALGPARLVELNWRALEIGAASQRPPPSCKAQSAGDDLEAL